MLDQVAGWRVLSVLRVLSWDASLPLARSVRKLEWPAVCSSILRDNKHSEHWMRYYKCLQAMIIRYEQDSELGEA